MLLVYKVQQDAEQLFAEYLMTVVLTLTSSEEWNALIDRSMISSVDNLDELEKADNSVLVKNSVSVEELRNALSVHESVILVYPAIQTLLSKELRAGTDSELAVTSTANLFNELLSVHRTARKKLKMLNMRSLNFATKEELTLLSEMSWNLQSNPVEAEDDIFTLAAYQIIHQNKKLKKLADLLTASSMPIGSANEEVKIDLALGKYSSKLREFETLLETAEKNKNALLESQQKIGAVEAEGEVLRLQVAQLQEELEKYFNLSRELENEKSLAAERERDANKSLEELNGLQAEKESEIELLQVQLSVIQSELETYFVKATEAERQKVEAQREISRLQEKNETAMRKSTALERKLNETEETKRRQHSDHIRETKQQQREYVKLELKFKQQRGEFATQMHQVERLTSELKNIKTSASWKISAPARAVSRVVSKVDRKKLKLRQDAGLIYTSELFDAEWYLKTYPDVKSANIDPAEHYLEYGAKEGRLPSASFDGNWYLKRYPDVADSDVNPLVHYLKFGQNEGRSASPVLLENFKD